MLSVGIREADSSLYGIRNGRSCKGPPSKHKNDDWWIQECLVTMGDLETDLMKYVRRMPDLSLKGYDSWKYEERWRSGNAKTHFQKSCHFDKRIIPRWFRGITMRQRINTLKTWVGRVASSNPVYERWESCVQKNVRIRLRQKNRTYWNCGRQGVGNFQNQLSVRGGGKLNSMAWQSERLAVTGTRWDKRRAYGIIEPRAADADSIVIMTIMEA